MSNNNLKRALDEALSGEYYLLLNGKHIPEHKFSGKFEKKMNKLIKRRRKPYFHVINTVGKRAACIIIAFLTASTATVMSVDALREAVIGFFMKTFDTYSLVKLVDDGSHPDTIEEIYEITYDLSGYRVEWEDNSISTRQSIYCKGDKYIYFFQYSRDIGDFFANTEDAVIYKTEINGYDGIYYLDNNDYNTFIWDDGRYTFRIGTNLDKNEAYEIAKSVKVAEN